MGPYIHNFSTTVKNLLADRLTFDADSPVNEKKGMGNDILSSLHVIRLH